MLRIALGWLGWSWEQASTCDINLIMIAYEGRVDMLKFIFGSPDKTPSPLAGPPIGGGGKPVVLTPQTFDVMFQ